MRKLIGICALGTALLLAIPAQGVNISLSAVGDPNNAPDGTGGPGTVTYNYWIGTYEVSIGQYTTFLNTVAANTTAPYLVSLWNPLMASDPTVSGITRSPLLGSEPYVYTSVGDANRPISYVSWLDAARFANWVNNGATTTSSTETGAYNLKGATSGIFDKQSGAVWWIPTENEWYKAAYYKGGGTSSGYWGYPMQSNVPPPTPTPPPYPGNTPGNASNQANYFNGTYSVPGENTNKLTPGGAFTASASAYGTFDQGGNLSEWNGKTIGISDKQIRGGSWNDNESVLRSSFSGSANPSNEFYNVGFRLASSVPEPSSLVLMTGAGLAAWWLARRKARGHA